MALYVTRPRRDEERIGRGLPSGFNQWWLVSHNSTLMATYCKQYIRLIEISGHFRALNKVIFEHV